METKTTYAYKKVMDEHKLTITELPEDAQTGIKSLQEIDRALALSEKKGKKPRQATLDKVKMLDKWVLREILDYVDDKNTNTEAPPVDPATIIEEIKEEKPPVATPPATPPATPAEKKEEAPAEEPKPDPKGVKVDEEFAGMLKAGKTDVTLEELKQMAPVAYSLIFEHHTNDLTNGITTSYYILKETEKDKFNLSKI